MTRNELILEIQERFQQSGGLLNERQRRLWAAEEALKLGRGGIATVSKALRISPNTIKKGMREISTAEADGVSDAPLRMRKSGGGRKPGHKSAEPPTDS